MMGGAVLKTHKVEVTFQIKVVFTIYTWYFRTLMAFLSFFVSVYRVSTFRFAQEWTVI